MYNGDYRDFDPRVGVAWDVRGNGKTVVRAAGSVITNMNPVTTFSPSNPHRGEFPQHRRQYERHGNQCANLRAAWRELYEYNNHVRSL